MYRGIKFKLFAIMSLFLLPGIILALSPGADFGGRVLSSEVTKINLLEKSGFSCTRPPGQVVKVRNHDGQVADIYLLNGTSYTKQNPVKNRVAIAGKLQFSMLQVTCTNGFVTIDASLPQVTWFGNSRR